MLLGGTLGRVLYHELFGFISAWPVFVADGRGAGLRAQMVMLAVAVVLFFPVLAKCTLCGHPAHGEHGEVGVSVLVGAFLFGLGGELVVRLGEHGRVTRTPEPDQPDIG